MSNKKTRTKAQAGGRGEKPATPKKSGKQPYSSYTYLIGIDPGVNTGVAVYFPKPKTIKHVSSRKIHHGVHLILALLDEMEERGIDKGQMFVRVEDARKRKWFGNAGREQLQGAGSIKRDCKIWEDFLTDYGIPFELVAPKNNKTKLNAEAFKKITGWEGRTNEHARDAAMLVFDL